MTSYTDLTEHQARILRQSLKILRDDMAAVGVEIESISLVFADQNNEHQNTNTQTHTQTYEDKDGYAISETQSNFHYIKKK